MAKMSSIGKIFKMLDTVWKLRFMKAKDAVVLMRNRQKRKLSYEEARPDTQHQSEMELSSVMCPLLDGVSAPDNLSSLWIQVRRTCHVCSAWATLILNR